jgi:nicotinate phosphoribosyltransferase
MPPAADRIIDPSDEFRQKDLSGATAHELLAPLISKGAVIAELPGALEAQQTARTSLEQLDTSNKRLLNPHSYPVGLEPALHDTRDRLIRAARGI